MKNIYVFSAANTLEVSLSLDATKEDWVWLQSKCSEVSDKVIEFDNVTIQKTPYAHLHVIINKKDMITPDIVVFSVSRDEELVVIRGLWDGGLRPIGGRDFSVNG